jgi:hypothetical protein
VPDAAAAAAAVLARRAVTTQQVPRNAAAARSTQRSWSCEQARNSNSGFSYAEASAVAEHIWQFVLQLPGHCSTADTASSIQV